MKLIAKTMTLAGMAWLMCSTAAMADQVTLNVLGHKVHQTAIEGKSGDNIIKKWTEANNVTPNWITLALDGVRDRLNRELTLNSTSLDVVFVLNPWMTDHLAGQLEPLESYQKKAPIEDFGGIAPSIVASTTTDKGLMAIPFRHATNGLFVNSTLLKERNVAVPEGGIKDVFAAARKLTYKKSDGTQVYGLAFGGADYSTPMTLLKAMGVNYIGNDGSVHADTPEMIKALQTLHDLYADGVLPPDITTMSIDELNSAAQNGRAAIIISNFSRYVSYNDPQKSQYPGQINAYVLKDLNGQPLGVTEFWSMAIPANSTHKDLAWSFIRAASTPDSTLREALNGNGPVRPSVYQDPRIQKMLPYWAAESEALQHATPAFPNLENSAEIITAFMQEFQAALIGMKTPEEAAKALQAETEALIRKKH